PLPQAAARRFLQKDLELSRNSSRFDLRSFSRVARPRSISLASCTTFHSPPSDSEWMSIFCECYDLPEAIESARLTCSAKDDAQGSPIRDPRKSVICGKGGGDSFEKTGIAAAGR